MFYKRPDPRKEIKEEEKVPFEPDQLELIEELNLFNYIELEGPNVTELQSDWFRVDMMV